MKSTIRILFIILCAIYISIRWNYIRLDGITGEICGIFFHTDTKYSMNYSHHKFVQVKIGMTENEVINILGEPIKRWNPYLGDDYNIKNNYIAFEYSISPSDTHYRLRSVHFFKGKVNLVNNCFYLD
jgi:hypothetical protein